MPILVDKVPRPCRTIIAEDIMAREVVTLKCVDSILKIEGAITKDNHHAFPVLNSKGECIGLIPRNYIIVLITKHWFYEKENQEIDESLKNFNLYNSEVAKRINSDKHRKYQVIREHTLACQRSRKAHDTSITNYEDLLDTKNF